MKSLIILAAFILFSTQAYAVPKITVHGTLKGYDTKTVKIQTKDALITVPRSSLKVPVKGLMVGVATVQAQLSIADMMKYNGSLKDKKK